MSRSLLKFENAIKSEATKKLYKYYLKKFVEYTNLKDSDSLLKIQDSLLQEQLEDYLFYLKKKISPNSIPPIFAAIELFLTMNDKVANFKKLRKMFPEKVKLTGKGYWENKDIQKMLSNIKIKRAKAMIHVMASTGCRVGALSELKIKHLENVELGCKKITFYEGSIKEYVGFLTPEANQALEEYFEERRKLLEVFTLDTPVFRSRFFVGQAKAKPLAVDSLKANLYISIHGESSREKKGNRYNIQVDHGFRKRFAVILKSNDSGNISLIEKLLGHNGAVPLDKSYFNPTPQKLFEEFKKHIANLTIDDNKRLKIENDIKEQKIKTLEDQKDKALQESENIRHQFAHRLRHNEMEMHRMRRQLDDMAKNNDNKKGN